MDQSGECCYVPVNDVWTVGQDDNKKQTIILTTKTAKYLFLLRGSLESASKFFAQFGIEEINAGTLVRMEALRFYNREDDLVRLENGELIQVSRRNRIKVKHLPEPPS
ncbi:hypothetical protein [Paenibacillus sp. YN15]|uniref:hypothetical protein n=1 Tax=Paenibacillus sp. YN15 TaxID=1742774 RepID=UPI0011BD619A|nr:hypothetical protein [Paenibacillus sp. YN15]